MHVLGTGIGVLMLVALTGAWALEAAPLPCAPGSLSDYAGLGTDGCTLGSLRVFDFTDLGALGSATPISPDDVTVTPYGSAPGVAGLTFGYGVAAQPGILLQSLFRFVLDLPVDSTLNAILRMEGSSVSGDGVNTAIEDFSLGATGTLIAFDIGIDQDLSPQMDLGMPGMVGLMMDVVVDPGLTGAASLESVTTEFATEGGTVVIPEPVTGLTAMLGLLGCICARGLRRRCKGGSR